MKLSDNAEKVLKARYLLKDEGGNCIEDVEGMFRRVAKAIAQADAQYGATKKQIQDTESDFFGLMASLDFLPNSPTLMNAGRPNGQLSACFVLPIPDSMEGIFDGIKNAALIHKSGGGTGFSFSRLRPAGSAVKTTGGIASGPVSFMKVFNAATEAVKQGGVRRGANMGLLRVDHPDIREFIQCKQQSGDITNFNISVGITEAFMDAVKEGTGYDLMDPKTDQPVKRENAREIFDMIVSGAWSNGEPGIVFLDRINKDNKVPSLGEIESTNPCVTGDTLVATRKGLEPIKDLVGTYPEILSVDGCYYPASKVVKTGVKPVYELLTQRGYKLKLTGDHRIYTDRGWVRADELNDADILYLNPHGLVSQLEKVQNKRMFREAYEDGLKSLTLLGEQHVYDLSELIHNCFYANGLLVHNCGEQPLLPYESCNLGSINLSNMVGENGFNEVRFLDTIEKAVHFLDNVIDVNQYPLPNIEKVTKSTRKIGLGVMGYADMLLKMCIPYDSEEALDLVGYIMGLLNHAGHAVSKELAKARGPFPAFRKSTYPKKLPLRNCTVTTIAPTGTLSMIANCSSGVEPIFGYVYYKEVLSGTKLPYVNDILLSELQGRGLYNTELVERIAKQGSLTSIDSLPSDLRKIFVCAHDISPSWHIRTQAAFQDDTDNAVSKTVNFANSATKADVEEVFMLAYEQGCKGVTVYRDGSRDFQVLNLGRADMAKSPTQKADGAIKIVIPGPRDRPKMLKGQTETITTGCGKLYVTINSDELGASEAFITTGKEGGCPSQSEATARLISLALRSGVSKTEVIEQLRGIRCFSTLRQKDADGTSCPDAIGRLLERIIKNEPYIPPTPLGQSFSREVEPEANGLCPVCKSPFLNEGGCVICKNCGWSKCI